MGLKEKSLKRMIRRFLFPPLPLLELPGLLLAGGGLEGAFPREGDFDGGGGEDVGVFTARTMELDIVARMTTDALDDGQHPAVTSTASDIGL